MAFIKIISAIVLFFVLSSLANAKSEIHTDFKKISLVDVLDTYSPYFLCLESKILAEQGERKIPQYSYSQLSSEINKFQKKCISERVSADTKLNSKITESGYDLKKTDWDTIIKQTLDFRISYLTKSFSLLEFSYGDGWKLDENEIRKLFPAVKCQEFHIFENLNHTIGRMDRRGDFSYSGWRKKFAHKACVDKLHPAFQSIYKIAYDEKMSDADKISFFSNPPSEIKSMERNLNKLNYFDEKFWERNIRFLLWVNKVELTPESSKTVAQERPNNAQNK